MTQQSDLEYFTRRNRQESDLASRAIEPSARKAHSALADLHRKKVGESLARSGEIQQLQQQDVAKSA